MNKEIIYSAPELVEVSYQHDLKAVVLKWFSEHDEGTGVKDAVCAALDYVRHRPTQSGTGGWVNGWIGPSRPTNWTEPCRDACTD